MYYIYALVDPINDTFFYIGKGKGDRAYQHLNGKDNLNKKKKQYIDNIRILGFEPKIIKLKENIIDEQRAYYLESCLIHKMIDCQIPLTNRVGVDLKPPSRKGSKWTKKQIEKRSATVIATGVRRGRVISPEQRLKISIKLKGKPNPRKVKVDVVLLKQLYLIENKTKSEIKQYFNIGLGSLNRILSENGIRKLCKY